jgi:cytochrome c553
MIRPVLFAAAALAASIAAPLAAAPPPQDTLVQRVVPCTTCHGKEGRASPEGYQPRIAGKPAGYLYNQLLNFRDGRRRYGPMVYLVDPLSDAYLREIAEHFAALELPYPPPAPATVPAAQLALGRALAHEGDRTREIPACAGCHGDALTGVQPATPGLLGLPRDYIAGQLGAWRSGQRHAHAPDCMADIARRLGPDDVAAVATWLASQPLPASTKPATALPRPAPLRCGSAQAE